MSKADESKLRSAVRFSWEVAVKNRAAISGEASEWNPAPLVVTRAQVLSEEERIRRSCAKQTESSDS